MNDSDCDMPCSNLHKFQRWSIPHFINDSNSVYVSQDPRLDESEEQNNEKSKLETDTSEEKETIVEKGDTDFKEIETEPKPEEVKYDSDFLIEGDLEEMMPNSDDYYDDYTAYTTPETTRLVQI